MKITSLVFAVLLSMGGPASAAIIASDSFNYLDGTLADGNQGTGWSGAWVSTPVSPATVASGSATFSLSVSGAAYTESQSSRGLSSSLGAGTTTWLRFNAGLTASSEINEAFGGIGLYAGGLERALIGKNWAGDAGAATKWALTARTTTNAVTPSYSSVDLSDGLAEVWVKITTLAGDNNDSISYWINSESPASEAMLGSAVETLTGQHLENVNTIRLRGGSSTSGYSATWTYDNLILADDFSSIAVPEPSPMAFIALAGFGLLRLRRP